MISIKQSSGFTLLEILIAVTIFAVIAVITTMGLHSVIKTQHHIKEVDGRLRAVITAMTIMRRDISQIVARPVLDTSGSEMPALLIPSKHELEFTRAGFTNPMGMLARSSLQRVAYIFSDDTLYRKTWPVLDRAQKTVGSKSILLQHVKSMHLNFVDDNGLLTEVFSTRNNPNALPKAIIVIITLKHQGGVRLVIPIRGRGYGL